MLVPSFHIVIATHGRLELLKRTLDSLARCKKPSSYQGTIVVENGCRSGIKSLLDSYKDLLNPSYLYTHHGNKSHALNLALDHIDSGLIFFTDDDVRLSIDILLEYEEAALECGPGTFFGGPIDVEYDIPPASWLSQYLPASARGWALNGIECEKHPWFLGFNWSAFHGDLMEIGGFDIRFGPGSSTGGVGQETDMQKRLQEAGVKQLFVPDAKVWHYVPVDRCSPEWVLQRQYRNGISDGYRYHYQAPALFGYPKWILKRAFWSAVNAARLSFLGRDRDAFSAKVELQQSLGILKGARARNRT